MRFPSAQLGKDEATGPHRSRYTKHIEKDAALERRFQRVNCEDGLWMFVGSILYKYPQKNKTAGV